MFAPQDDLPPDIFVVCPLCHAIIDNSDNVEEICILNHLRNQHAGALAMGRFVKEVSNATVITEMCSFCDEEINIVAKIKSNISENNPIVVKIDQLLSKEQETKRILVKEFPNLCAVDEYSTNQPPLSTIYEGEDESTEYGEDLKIEQQDAVITPKSPLSTIEETANVSFMDVDYNIQPEDEANISGLGDDRKIQQHDAITPESSLSTTDEAEKIAALGDQWQIQQEDAIRQERLNSSTSVMSGSSLEAMMRSDSSNKDHENVNILTRSQSTQNLMIRSDSLNKMFENMKIARSHSFQEVMIRSNSSEKNIESIESVRRSCSSIEAMMRSDSSDKNLENMEIVAKSELPPKTHLPSNSSKEGHESEETIHIKRKLKRRHASEDENHFPPKQEEYMRPQLSRRQGPDKPIDPVTNDNTTEEPCLDWRPTNEIPSLTQWFATMNVAGGNRVINPQSSFDDRLTQHQAFINIQIDESHRNTENLKSIVAEIGQINLNERCPQAVQSPKDPVNTDQQDTDTGNQPIGPPPSKLQKKN